MRDNQGQAYSVFLMVLTNGRSIHLLRRIILAAALAGIRGIHAHQEFVSIAEGINRVVLIVAQLHLAQAVQELDEFLVPLGNGAA